MSFGNEDFYTKENLKVNIRRFRESSDFTQTQVAVLMGTNRTTYTKWESGDSLPNAIQLQKLASIYGKRIDDFYTDHNALMVSNPIFDKPHGNAFISDLTKEEKVFLAKYRMLSDSDKETNNKMIEELRTKN